MLKVCTFILILLLVPFPSYSRCVRHTVVRGESLRSLAGKYYGLRRLWTDIKYQNNLHRNMLYPKQKLWIYIPDKDLSCTSLIYRRLEQLGLKGQDKQKLASAFTAGIDNALTTAHHQISRYLPREPGIAKFELCRWLLVTAQQESFFKFAVGSAGEIGIFQFKLDTVRLAGSIYHIRSISMASDAELVSQLLHPESASFIFALYFSYLQYKYHNLWFAWKKYNSGSEADAYADRAQKLYWKIRRLVPYKCGD